MDSSECAKPRFWGLRLVCAPEHATFCPSFVSAENRADATGTGVAAQFGLRGIYLSGADHYRLGDEPRIAPRATAECVFFWISRLALIPVAFVYVLFVYLPSIFPGTAR